MTCSVEGCESSAHCRGWCPAHYSRWARHGDPLAGGPTKPRPFWDYVDQSGGIDSCWPWMGGRNRAGYGVYNRPSRRGKTPAHRWALAQAIGHEIPCAHGVHHQCDNPSCCNPLHLTHAPQRQNVAEMVERGRSAKGEAHSQAKLTEAQAAEILASSEPARAVAERMGVSRGHVYEVRAGRRWKHLHHNR